MSQGYYDDQEEKDDDTKRLLASVIGQRGEVIGDHVWSGHHGTIVRVERTLVGWGVVVHLENDHETFIFDGPRHWRADFYNPFLTQAL